MTDEQLIEAIARAMFKDDQVNRLDIVKTMLAIARPIIEAPLRAENEKLRDGVRSTIQERDVLSGENWGLRAELAQADEMLKRQAQTIKRLQEALDCFLEQATPTQWRYSRERAEKLAKGILAAAALKETNDDLR